jgi:hypothetical protein
MMTKLADSIAPANPDSPIHIVNKLTGWEIALVVIGSIVLVTLMVLMVLNIVKQIRGLKLSPSQKLEKHNSKIQKAQSKISLKQAKFDKKIAELMKAKSAVTPSK